MPIIKESKEAPTSTPEDGRAITPPTEQLSAPAYAGLGSLDVSVDIIATVAQDMRSRVTVDPTARAELREAVTAGRTSAAGTRT